MTDCADVRIRELLPDYMHDALESRDRAMVQLHLRGCAACREELEVLERCRATMGVVPTVDVARIVGALPTPPTSASPQLRLASPSGRGWRGMGGWRVAAMALLTVGAVGVAVSGGHWQVAGSDERVATASDRGAGTMAGAVPTLAFADGLSELSDASIGELLAEVEQMEALPEVEPRPMVLAGDVDGSIIEETGGS